MQLSKKAAAEPYPYVTSSAHLDCAAETLPDEGLAMRVYEYYMRLDQLRRRLNQHHPLRHLAVLRQFAALWQPSVVLVMAPACPGQPHVALCAELQVFATSLSHLELSSPTATWINGLTGLNHLNCLSLRNCPHLSTAALQQVLQQLPQLTSLDLCGLSGVSDALAPTLVSLTNLVVLQINRTSCTDATIEWLTYGDRLHQWRTQQQHQAGRGRVGAGAAEAPLGPLLPQSPHSTQEWPRTKIRSWHLAYTGMTPRVVELLLCCHDIVLLDLRGSGVKAAQLAPLHSRYALSAVQGAVLSRTAAMVLAAVTLEQFVCADAAQHSGAIIAVRAVAGPDEAPTAAAAATHDLGSSWQMQSAGAQQWVHHGIAALLQGAAEVLAAGLQHAAHPKH